MRRLALVTVLCCPAACQGSQPAAPAAKAQAEGPAKAAPPPTAKAAPAEEPSNEGPPKTVLVELYSSQGCDSCPKADAYLGTFPAQGWDRDAVIPLTFHVTYWDDLGWSDPFARPLFDQRQIGYAQTVPGARADDETTIRGPYTPQMVVDGRVHFSGTLEDVARQEIERARKRPTLIDLEIRPSVQGQTVKVDVHSAMAKGASFDTDRSKVGLFAALSQASVQTEVPRGENAGKKLTEFWVVRDFAGPKLFRSAREKNETRFELALPEGVEANAAQVVVFAQDLATMGIVAAGAAKLDGTPAVAAAG